MKNIEDTIHHLIFRIKVRMPNLQMTEEGDKMHDHCYKLLFKPCGDPSDYIWSTVGIRRVPISDIDNNNNIDNNNIQLKD